MTLNAFCYKKNTIRADAYGFWGGYLNCTGSYKWFKKCGAACPKNNILSMTLDLTETEDKKLGTLSFMINNKSFGNKNAFENIDINKQYCMALAVFDDDNFQLIE